MKIICGFLLIFIGFINIFAQDKAISESEFKIVHNKWIQLSKQQTYRINRTIESQLNGKPSNHTEESYFEYVPPDRRRYVSEIKTQRLNTKTETIQIGEKKYTRKDFGEWKEVEVKEKSQSKRSYKITDEQREYRYIGKESLDNQKADVYERLIKHKIIDDKSQKESFSTIKEKYWFGENGLLLKMQMETEIVSGIMRSFSRRVWTYEYDPNIKIEVPIIPEQ